jgi:hypothetical protein
VIVPVQTVADYLNAKHYLGAARRGVAWSDEYGVIVVAAPTSRRLPTDWLEITRWCIEGKPNSGSIQYSALRKAFEGETTTIVSYSDPSVGHTGALYRACGFGWAPTWHRLRTPPTGNGQWTADKVQSVKDRWVDPLAPDSRRLAILQVNDSSLMRRMPWASWQEPVIVRNRVRRGTAGGDYRRFAAEHLAKQ